jgi:hypothetical protein
MEAQARQEIKEQRTEQQEQTQGTGQANPARPIENPAVSIQNSQPVSESVPAGQGRSVTESSRANPRIQNLLQSFASSSTADKGNLLDVVS